MAEFRVVVEGWDFNDDNAPAHPVSGTATCPRGDRHVYIRTTFWQLETQSGVGGLYACLREGAEGT